jgi:hypothetical protein
MRSVMLREADSPETFDGGFLSFVTAAPGTEEVIPLAQAYLVDEVPGRR